MLQDNHMGGPKPIVLKADPPPYLKKELDSRNIYNNDILICADSDLAITGEYCKCWLVVTRQEILVYQVNEDSGGNTEIVLIKHVHVKEVETARTDTRVGSGFIELRIKGVYKELVRFTNRYAEKFAKIAAQIRALAVGQEVVIKSPKELEEAARSARGFQDTPHLKVRRGTVFFRFLRYTSPYWPYTVLAMLLVVATIALMVFPQQLVKVLIDNVFNEQDPVPAWFEKFVYAFNLEKRLHWLYLLVGLLAATTLLNSLIGIFREALSAWINNKLGYDLRREVFAKLEDLAIRYHESQPVGQLMTRCSQDIETLQAFINQLTSGFGFQLLLVIGVAATMFTMNWVLALIACVPAPFVMAATYVFTKWVTPKWRKYWTRRSDLNSFLHSVLSGIRVVKAYAQEKREEQRFARVSGGFCDIGLNVGIAQAIFYPSMGFVFQLGGYFIWIYGGAHILSGEGVAGQLSVGELIAFLGYLGMFYAPLNSLTQMSTWFTQFTTQAHRVFEVLDQKSDILDREDAREVEIQGSIEFKNVTFGYDPHIPVLKDVSFKVAPGEMIGIVGHSGCGKSTTVSLIMRFYEVSEGVVLIDNTDVRMMRKQHLRKQIGLVAQDPFLFRGTIAENIAYGNPEAAPELLLDAALQANAHMFIVRNHDGYDTRLGERGAGLSGGERQRVAIAQALLHNPRILILDEATSSVDTISEREIQRSLEALSRGRTTLAIAHRLSTLRNCDRILVFEDGEIREQGSHDELMKIEGGIYFKLVQTQVELTRGSASVDGLQDLNALEEAEQKVHHYVRNTVVPRIHYLDVKLLHITALAEGDMRVQYGDVFYDHVRAYRCFPVSRPHEFIALWTGATALEHREIGMIRRLSELSPETRAVVDLELKKRYFIHYIEEIVSIKENRDNIGYLIWHVKTDKGEMQFITRRWDRHVVQEGGKNGRIIFDIDENRYEIVDLNRLDASSRSEFLAHIFW